MSPDSIAIGARLRAARKAHGLVVADLAERFRDVAPEKVRPRLPKLRDLERTLRSHEAGEHAVGERYRLLWARALDTTEEELFGAHDTPTVAGHVEAVSAPAHEADDAGVRELSGAPPRGSVEATDPINGGDVERRRLMQDAAALVAGAAAAPVLTTLTAAWAASTPSLPGATVSQAMIDDWEDAVHLHGQRARIDPPTVVLAALAADFTDMAPHLAHTQPDPVRRDLARAASRHCALIAGKWIDLGNRREARRWFAKTRALADESGDHFLASWLRGREAVYRVGDPSEDLAEVLLVAQDARRLAGDRPSVPLVAALTVEAEALAKLGQCTQAISTLGRAETTFDRLSTVTDLEYGRWSRLNQGLWYDKSLVYTLAGDVKRATEAQETLLRPSTEKLTTISVSLHSAGLHARSDPEQGMAHAARIIDELPVEHRRTRHLSTARIALDLAPEKARTLPAARELRALTVGSALT
jgi:transcriptional regulator with XRE-family HTH domain